MNIVIERRLVNLNSEDATQFNNGTYLSDVNFDFTGLLKDQRNIIYCEGGVLNAQIPVSFYQVAYYNNTLYYTVAGNPFSITVPVGNYNFSTFATALQTAFTANGHNFAIIINDTTGRLQFSLITGGTGFVFLGASSGTTIFKILGFDPTQNYPDDGVNNLLAPYLLNLLGAKKLKIFSTTFSNTSYDSASATSCNLISTISVDAPSYGLLLYNNTQDKYGRLKTKRIDNIDIQIKDEYGNMINFNNTDWSITLAVLIYRTIDTRISDLNDVFNAMMAVNNTLETLPDALAESLQRQEIPAEQIPAEEVPAEEVPAEEVPAEEVATEEIPPVEEQGQEPENLAEGTSDLDLLLYENPAIFG